jgi:hypothetical protein
MPTSKQKKQHLEMVLRLEDATSKRTRDAFDTEAMTAINTQSDDRSGAHTRKQAMTALT